MELNELMRCIASNTIPHYLIFFGEEQKIIDLYLDKICSNYKPVRLESVSQVINQLGVKSLDKSNKCYIITEDESYCKAEDKWEHVKKRMEHSNHILVIRYANINKNNKFFTRNKQNIIEFPHLQPNILTQYIQKDINLSDDNCEKLISMCGNDYGRILLEVDKIKQYREGYGKNKQEKMPFDGVFLRLLNDSAIYSEIGDITFELTDAVLSGHIKKALKKLDEAKRKGEPVLRIASILYTGFRNLLAYQGLGKNKQDASKRTGLTGWQIKQCIDLPYAYNMQDLIRNISLCQRVEVGIKAGLLDEDIALDYLIINCLK